MMKRRNHSTWWAPSGDGPTCFGPDNPQLNSRFDTLKSLCKNGPLYAVENRNGETRYGKVEVHGDRIFIYSFQSMLPRPLVGVRFISLRELLSRYNVSDELPKTAFLKLTPRLSCGFGSHDEDSRDFEDDAFKVVVETDGTSLRAKNFVLLCSALRRHSYKGLTMTLGEGIDRRRDPFVCGIRRFRALFSVVTGMDSNSCPKTPLKDGWVYGMNENDSWFMIPLKDNSTLSFPPIGRVVAGLQNLKKVKRGYKIKECGLVI